MSNSFNKLIYGISLFALSTTISLTAEPLENPNQTPTTSEIHSGDELPFTIQIKRADFSLPAGLHSGVFAVHEGKWLLFAGRTNGLHGFDSGDNNFPPLEQNTLVYVVDPHRKSIVFKSLYDGTAGLTQAEIDTLSVTSPQFYQDKNTLYITGGYGVETLSGLFSTKSVLTAVNIPKLIAWVLDTDNKKTAREAIRQISDPIFQVTGGHMAKGEDDLTLLVFGQNFQGFYHDDSNGEYTEQVRRFRIKDKGKRLKIEKKDSVPAVKDSSYRRRDLNVVPAVLTKDGRLKEAFIAWSGVFTEGGGIWTVPVFLSNKGKPSMPDPSSPHTFKQGMNNYASATVGLFSNRDFYSYTILLGGISYGYFENGIFKTDAEFPFINQITTIRVDKYKHPKQYLMKNEYPLIYSTGSNPGNQLLFGAAADFIPARHVPHYPNGVVKLDALKKKTLLGYVVGGIASTLPNTNTQADSTASNYIFKVYLYPK